MKTALAFLSFSCAVYSSALVYGAGSNCESTSPTQEDFKTIETLNRQNRCFVGTPSAKDEFSDFIEIKDPKIFRNALANSHHSKYPDRVWIRDIHGDGEYAGYQDLMDEGGHFFLSHDHLAGFGVTKDHELISLFNNGTQKGLGARMIRFALGLGANHLWCWGKELVKYYEKFAFVEKRTIPWRADIWINDTAPPDPKPNIYCMELKSASGDFCKED